MDDTRRSRRLRFCMACLSPFLSLERTKPLIHPNGEWPRRHPVRDGQRHGPRAPWSYPRRYEFEHTPTQVDRSAEHENLSEHRRGQAEAGRGQAERRHRRRQEDRRSQASHSHGHAPSCGCNAQKKEACSNLLLARAGGTTLAVPPHGVYEHAARRLAAPEPWRWSRCGKPPRRRRRALTTSTQAGHQGYTGPAPDFTLGSARTAGASAARGCRSGVRVRGRARRLFRRPRGRK